MVMKTNGARSRILIFVAFVLLLGVGALFLPSNQVIERPGPTVNVLGDVADDAGSEVPLITLHGTKEYRGSAGQIDLLTVYVDGTPEYPLNWWQILRAQFNEKKQIAPMEWYYPNGASLKQVERVAEKQMSDSQLQATRAALSEAGLSGADALQLAQKADFAVAGIGGPSAGLAFALGVYDLATAGSLVGKHHVAATGEIDKAGNVRGIGGLPQKLWGAAAAGADTVFISPENCIDLPASVPNGMRVVPVATVAEAIAAAGKLGQGKGVNLPSCPV